MHCKRIELNAEVIKYELGKNLEDGFELFVDVVTKDWVFTNSIIQHVREDGVIVCPYIFTRRGKVFIQKNDYIIKDEDGTRHVCGADKVWKRYKKAE